MKYLKRVIKRSTALIPVDVQFLKQNKALRRIKSHPYASKVGGFVKSKPLISLLVILPWLLAAFYILFIKSPVYESTAKILIEKSEDNAQGGGLGLLLGGTHVQPSENYLTKDYILSREMLAKVEKNLNIKAHFQSKKADFFSRLSKNATQKDFLTYYREMLKASIDPETNEIIIQASAYSPDFAKTFLSNVLNYTKDFVNQVSNTLAKKQYDFAEMKLKLAKEKLFQTSNDLIQWQNKNGLFDPKEAAQVVSSVMAQLKGSLVEKQTQYITYSSFMQPNSTKLLTLQEEINALKQQVQQQTSILLGKKETSGKLNQVVSEFEWFQLQQKFAQAEYQAAQQAYDVAAINLAKNQNIVIEIEHPDLPDEPKSPVPFYDLTNILLLLLILFVITKMGITIVREHID